MIFSLYTRFILNKLKYKDMSTWISLIKKCDLYKKLPTELSEPTTAGAVISVIATIFMLVLFLSEFKTFLTVEERTEIFIETNPV